MDQIEVIPLSLPQDIDRFIKPWWDIYRDDEQWVAPLIFERKEFFNPSKNPYFKVADVQCFLAMKNGEPAGTIAATVDHLQQEHDPGLGLFGFFEFINDAAVARALLEAARLWLHQQGMLKMIGPFNFNPNHEFGLVVDGFDTPPCVANPHNSAYFPEIYKELGLKVCQTWFAYWLIAGPMEPRIKRITDRFLKRHPEVSIRTVSKKNFPEEVKIFWDVYNDAWSENWGHVRLTKEEFDFKAAGLKSILDEDLCYIAEVDGVPAAVSISLRDYNQVAKKMNGRIFPFGWFHYLFGKNKIDTLRVLILGVKKDFQHLALGAPLYARTWEAGLRMGVRGAECSLVLEDNARMRGALEKLGGKIYKTYQTFEMATVDDDGSEGDALAF